MTTELIEDALFCSHPFPLSYSDPNQKWIIRDHLISLLHDFPTLKPSAAPFTHDDGTLVHLLYAAGHLPVSPHAPPVPLTFWLHELYPHMPPMVFINVHDSPLPIYNLYPFADSSSGATASAYISHWHFAKSSLSGLAHNLIKLFRHNHPFYYTEGSGKWSHPSIASKIEATDRLVSSIYYDVAAITSAIGEEIENLGAVQGKLKERCESMGAAMSELENERRRLKLRVNEVCEEADRVLNWLKVYGDVEKWSMVAVDDAFEGVDERSEMEMEAVAGDLAVEDLMYKLEKAVEGGAVSFDVYLKHVRVLAREQFQYRAKLEKIRTSFFNKQCVDQVQKHESKPQRTRKYAAKSRNERLRTNSQA